MANDKIQYALKKGTELHSSSKNLLGISVGEEKVYTIEKAMGQGGFGITYLATRKIGNITQAFAVKEFFVKGMCWREDGKSRMMYPEAAEAKQNVKEWLSEFEKEGEILNQICKKTPNIVQVNEVIRANDTAYYVMEYLEGGSLRDVVKQGALQEDIAMSYVLPIVKAVHIMHTMKQPLLHCDIKHDNIMLRKHIDGVVEPVLIDFGESRHFNEKGNLTTTHTTIGCSRGFAPMEQYLGITTFTPQVDVYALAATLYYVVTGDEPPFADDVTEKRILEKLPAGISDSLKKAIVHGMQKDKEKRTKDTGLFYQELCGCSIDGAQPPGSIVRSELPIGYALYCNNGKRYEIVSVVSNDSFFIRYKVACGDSGNDLSGSTRRAQFDIYEFFDKQNHRRQENKSVVAKGNVDAAHGLFLGLCKKITKGAISKSFQEESNVGWITFSSNNTYYIVDTHYRKPLPWKRILTYSGICMGSILLVYGAISIYDNIKESKQKEAQQQSLRLTEAIDSNDAAVLQEFAEEYDSTRAYLPYALICLENGDFETAERFANDSLKRVIKQKKDSIEQRFDSLFYAAKSQYDAKQYLLAQETLNKIDNEFISRQKVKDLVANIEQQLHMPSVQEQVPVTTEKENKPDNTPTVTKSDDELYKEAMRKSDWKSIKALADKGYTKAYVPLAKHYLNSPSTHSLASEYAHKAKRSGIAGADDIIKQLELLDFE